LNTGKKLHSEGAQRPSPESMTHTYSL
jgi:hypothetical protein